MKSPFGKPFKGKSPFGPGAGNGLTIGGVSLAFLASAQPYTVEAAELISLADSLAAGGTYGVSLTISDGDIAFSGTTGLTGDTTGTDGTLDVTGSLANINTALDGLVISNVAAGSRTLTIVFSHAATSRTTTRVLSVIAGVNVANSVAPVVSGNALFGSTLTATEGTWTGTPAPTLTGLWYRGASPISGQTGLTYVTQVGDVGSAIKYRVTGENQFNSVSADSNTITVTDGTAVAPVFTAPVNQEIITEDVLYTVTVTSTGDTAVELFDGVSKIGDMVDEGGGVWTYDWTPSSVDYDVQLNAVGNVSGQGETLTIVVAEANLISQNIHSDWTKDRVTTASGYADPDGGNNAYRVTMNNTTGGFSLSRDASSAPANANSGQEVWIGYPTANADDVPYVRFYSSSDGNNKSGSIDLRNGQACSTHGSGHGIKIAIVERKIVGSVTWVRIWMQFVNATAGPQNMRFYFFKGTNLAVSTAVTFSGTEIVYVFEPRTADGTLPYTEMQEFMAYKKEVSGQLETYTMNWRLDNTVTNLASGSIDTYVIKPSSYSTTGDHSILMALPAVDVDQANNDLRTIMQDYADSYGCVVIIPRFRNAPAFYWAGCKDDGSADNAQGTILWMEWLIEQIPGLSSDREKHLLIGYSKSAFAAISLLLRNPTKFGYAYGWDGKYENPWADDTTYSFGWAGAVFGTEAQMRLYDPAYIVDDYKNNVNDKQRVIIGGYATWGPPSENEQEYLKDIFDAESVPVGYEQALWVGHHWESGWLPDAMENLFDMAGLITAPVNTVLPAISGDPYEAEILTCSTGTWSGPGTITYTYQWKRDGVSIGSATNATYTVTATDVDTDLTCTVTATNLAGPTSATSAALTILPGSNPDPGPTDGILLEDGTSYRLLEDGTSFRVQETQ